MAIRFSAGNRLGRTATVPDHETPYTMMFWARYITTVGQAYIANINEDATPNYDIIGSNSTNQLWVRCYWGGDGDAVGSTLSADTWYHMALVRESATSLKAYLNGALDTSTAKDVTGRTTPTRLDVSGYASGGGSQFTGRLQAFKLWTAALTIDEVNIEMRQIAPARFASLGQFHPLISHADLGDYGGNGRNFTAGTFTTEDGPPVPWRAGASIMRAAAAAASGFGALLSDTRNRMVFA